MTFIYPGVKILKNNYMPTKKANSLPKFTFLYLLSLISLIFLAISAGVVAFQLINKWLPDPLTGYTISYTASSLKFGLSALLISTPLYFWAVSQINRGLVKREISPQSDLRRWLIYFILLVTAIVMSGWLVALVYHYLDGELTGQFLAKAIVAIGIAATIFGFYHYDLHRNPQSPSDKYHLHSFAWPVAIVIIGLIIGGFAIAESPTEARNRRYDEKLIGNFYQIDSALNVYYQENKHLPATLQELTVSPYYLDPAALKTSEGEAIRYRGLGNNQYELCALWHTNNINPDKGVRTVGVEKWPHEAGYQCIKQVIWEDSGGPVEQPLK